MSRLAKLLQRQAVQFAICPLVQHPTRPLIMVKTPECFQFLVFFPTDMCYLEPPSTEKSVDPRSEALSQPASVHSLHAYIRPVN